jgi:hypothetical protein
MSGIDHGLASLMIRWVSIECCSQYSTTMPVPGRHDRSPIVYDDDVAPPIARPAISGNDPTLSNTIRPRSRSTRNCSVATTPLCSRAFAADLHCSQPAPAAINVVASTSASAEPHAEDDTNRCISMQNSRSACSGEGAQVRVISRGLQNANAKTAIDAAKYRAMASDPGRPACDWLDAVRPDANTSGLSTPRAPCFTLRPREPLATRPRDSPQRIAEVSKDVSRSLLSGAALGPLQGGAPLIASGLRSADYRSSAPTRIRRHDRLGSAR